MFVQLPGSKVLLNSVRLQRSRLRGCVPDTDGRLWQFESVGGLGSSAIVSLAELDDEEDQSKTPRFVSARRIIGVLYTI